jgi:hypothetical protein
MKAVHIISLIARVALMVTLVLGLFFWIAQLGFLNPLLTILVQIGFTNIHELFGITGILFFLVLGTLAVFTRGSRLLGVGSIIYAFIVPALGLTQALLLVSDLHWLIQIAHLLLGIGAMYLALTIEKRYRRLRFSDHSPRSSLGTTLQTAR